MMVVTAESVVCCSGTPQAFVGSTVKDACWELHDRNCT